MGGEPFIEHVFNVYLEPPAHPGAKSQNVFPCESCSGTTRNGNWPVATTLTVPVTLVT